MVLVVPAAAVVAYDDDDDDDQIVASVTKYVSTLKAVNAEILWKANEYCCFPS